jgi:hypothetical protein
MVGALHNTRTQPQLTAGTLQFDSIEFNSILVCLRANPTAQEPITKSAQLKNKQTQQIHNTRQLTTSD